MTHGTARKPGTLSRFCRKNARVPAVLLFSLLCAALPRSPLSAQESLAGEIRNIGERLASRSLSPAERAAALRRLARLQALDGGIEAASETWVSAAFVNPAFPDFASLLEAARCHVALGDYAAADREFGALFLAQGLPPALLLEARYLAAAAQAFRTGGGEALQALLPVPEFSPRAAAILFMLWRITGEERWETRLRVEHPRSPEAAAAAAGAGALPPAGPMWFFFGQAVPMPGGSVAGALPVPANTAPPPVSGAALSGGTASPRAGDGTVLLQTGLFSREENARVMAERLRQAGFQASVLRREANGTGLFQVSVPPEESVSGTVNRLKDAGFEAFPVYPPGLR